MGAAALAVLAFGLGGFIQGCTGFGFSMVATPLLMLMLSPREVVPLVLLFSFLNLLVVAFESRHNADRRLVAPLTAGGWAGMFVGIALLQSLSGPTLKAAAGVVLVLVAAAMLSGWRRPIAPRPLRLAGVGVLSGIMGGSMSISGPPVIVFLTNQGVDKATFRASISSYFTFLGIFSLSLLVLNGLVTADLLRLGLVAFPCQMLTTWLGIRASRRIRSDVFARIALGLVCVMGLILVSTSLYALFTR